MAAGGSEAPRPKAAPEGQVPCLELPTYAAACELVHGPYSCLVAGPHRRHIALSPRYLHRKRTGIREQLDAELLRYSERCGTGGPGPRASPQGPRLWAERILLARMVPSGTLPHGPSRDTPLMGPPTGTLLAGARAVGWEDPHRRTLPHGTFPLGPSP